MRLHIIRHGDPNDAARREGLSAIGEREAEALAERFAATGLDAIYTSPLSRAEQTARTTADRLGMSYTVEPWAYERAEWRIDDHVIGQCTAWNLDPHEARLTHNFAKEDDWHTQPPLDQADLASDWCEIIARSDALLARHGLERDGHRYRVTQDNEQQIAVFCHMGLGLTWLAHLLGFPPPLVWASFFLPTSSVTTVLFEQRRAGFATPRCMALGDTSHLYAAGLPIQHRGLKANTC